MLQNFIQVVRDNASLLTSTSIPSDRTEEAVTLAGSSIYDGMKSVISSGGLTTVMHFFKGGESNLIHNPLVKEVTTNFINRFTSAFGMGTQEASNLAGSFLPGALDSIVAKTHDPADKSFDMQAMFDNFTEGKTSKFNLHNIFNKIKAGLDKDDDGDVDLRDFKLMFSGVVDKIKNVFK